MLSKKGTDLLVYIGCKFSKGNTKSGPKVEMSYLKVLRDPIRDGCRELYLAGDSHNHVCNSLPR